MRPSCLLSLSMWGWLFVAAWFLYSDDGGLTWSHGTPPIKTYYAIGLSNVDDTHAFAAMINALSQVWAPPALLGCALEVLLR